MDARSARPVRPGRAVAGATALKLAVLGVGLIGGSIGLAARRRAGATVSGYDPDPRACAAALELGAIDEQAPDIATAVAGAQVVFAAAPVGALAATVREALAHAGRDCVVSDVGSTKLALERGAAGPALRRRSPARRRRRRQASRTPARTCSRAPPGT